MALFRRRTTTTDIPELQEYYAAKRANNSVGAWVLALISLIITVLIILGLFFGGRWLWRKIRGDDQKVATTTQNAGDQVEDGIESDTGVDVSDATQNAADETEEAVNDAADSVENAANNSGNSSAANNANNNSASNSSNTGSSTANNQDNQTGASSTSTGTPNTDQQIAAAQAERLPNSGPGDVAGLFVGATAAGYVIHRRKIAKSIR